MVQEPRAPVKTRHSTIRPKAGETELELSLGVPGPGRADAEARGRDLLCACAGRVSSREERVQRPPAQPPPGAMPSCRSTVAAATDPPANDMGGSRPLAPRANKTKNSKRAVFISKPGEDHAHRLPRAVLAVGETIHYRANPSVGAPPTKTENRATVDPLCRRTSDQSFLYLVRINHFMHSTTAPHARHASLHKPPVAPLGLAAAASPVAGLASNRDQVAAVTT
ncbi:predicted protein [Pyrenophora tritici-repentis Pt-1C-BFP]|uniref:Uncharacterized protein n=1 Tax=Pyrenophora tritici-repentis (strain Pt-1C-BFP) TaxID=426418 RepID=B2WK30_PYRTR|nr:uncharacterized protein PTRG_10219 [Pyrenophora tritici-repentis Pt-1C-BFP]EDU43270.1 predicted protein [Pyrenophora tritici-repentis Pt-1C-BFP]